MFEYTVSNEISKNTIVSYTTVRYVTVLKFNSEIQHRSIGKKKKERNRFIVKHHFRGIWMF